MADLPALDPRTTALVVMDYQTKIVEGVSADPQSLLARTARLVAGARKAGMLVAYVVVGFRPGYPEIADSNAFFTSLKQSGRYGPGATGTEIHPLVAPQSEEPVITKSRISAFAGTDLDMILRARGITTLILCGVASSGCVLSTVRHAADADYRLVIVSDCCDDRDPEVHRLLMEKLFPRQGAVVTVEQAVAGM